MNLSGGKFKGTTINNTTPCNEVQIRWFFCVVLSSQRNAVIRNCTWAHWPTGTVLPKALQTNNWEKLKDVDEVTARIAGSRHLWNFKAQHTIGIWNPSCGANSTAWGMWIRFTFCLLGGGSYLIHPFSAFTTLSNTDEDGDHSGLNWTLPRIFFTSHLSPLLKFILIEVLELARLAPSS